MTSQSIMIEDTILAMKRVINKNKPDAISDSDSEPAKPTNRANKLKRKSRYYQEGQLGGHKPYKRKVDHAGHKRFILQRNPRRYDEDGYELFDDDTDEEADEEAAGKNPYNGLRLESLLMPLTQASDLSNHPALSIPYKSQMLPKMVQEACDMVHRERRLLSDMKALLAKFRGDPIWMPLGAMTKESDLELFGDYPQSDGKLIKVSLDPKVSLKETFEKGQGYSIGRHAMETGPQIIVNGEAAAKEVEKVVEKVTETERPTVEVPESTARTNGTEAEAEEPMIKDEPAAPEEATETNTSGNKPLHEPQESTTNGEKSTHEDSHMKDADTAQDQQNSTNNADQDQSAANIPAEEEGAQGGPKSSNPPTPSVISSAGNSPPRMLTRRRAKNGASSAADPASPRDSLTGASPPGSELPIHPLYIPPTDSMPSRDFALPGPEAEDSRRILAAWVQKQEEVCRGVERLHEGLLKAQRLRNTVWRWSRAEGHLGEMSDSEDWVDLDEWGLEQSLKKGAEEGAEEEPGKKTRGRRTAGG